MVVCKKNTFYQLAFPLQPSQHTIGTGDVQIETQGALARRGVQFCILVAIWLAAYKSADVFGFFKSYSSLWFLPSGATIAIVLVAPGWLKFAPLVANLLLAIPAICWALAIPFTNFHDPVLHAVRLYAIYGGTAVLLTRFAAIQRPAVTLSDTQWLICASLAAAIIASVTGVTLHVLVGNMDWSIAREIVVQWAVGDAIGALIVPPMLVPLLLVIFPNQTSQWHWPSSRSVLAQIALVCAALSMGFLVPRANPELGGLWYIIIIPPVLFALRGGLYAASTSVFLTNLLTPPAAFLLGFGGEKLGLQLLLLISSAAGLLVGAAITDRRRAFADLVAQRAHLEDQVVERTQALEEAYEFQRHLVRSIGHDLRQPVQAMNFMLDGLAKQMEGSVSAAAISKTREIGTAASDLLSKILDYARSNTGSITPITEPFPVSRVFLTLERVYAPMALAKNIRLSVQPCDAVLVSDEHLITQALSNFIDNALRLSVDGMTVTLECVQGSDETEIIVRDEIPSSAANQPGAAGFGLEIVRRIAEMLDLKIVQKPNLFGLSL